VKGDEVLLEGREVGVAAGLEAGILDTHVGEERPHVREGRLHGVSSDGFTALGYRTRAVADGEDLEEVELVGGGVGGEMGVGSEVFAKGAPDLLGVSAGTAGRSHDCEEPGVLRRDETMTAIVAGFRRQRFQERGWG